MEIHAILDFGLSYVVHISKNEIWYPTNGRDVQVKNHMYILRRIFYDIHSTTYILRRTFYDVHSEPIKKNSRYITANEVSFHVGALSIYDPVNR